MRRDDAQHEPLDVASVTGFLDLLRHPVRLPLLLELERLGESSATDLTFRLGAPFDTVNFALRQLAKAGAIVFVRQESRPGANVSRRIYAPRATGWADFVAQLDHYRRALAPPDTSPGE